MPPIPEQMSSKVTVENGNIVVEFNTPNGPLQLGFDPISAQLLGTQLLAGSASARHAPHTREIAWEISIHEVETCVVLPIKGEPYVGMSAGLKNGGAVQMCFPLEMAETLSTSLMQNCHLVEGRDQTKQ